MSGDNDRKLVRLFWKITGLFWGVLIPPTVFSCYYIFVKQGENEGMAWIRSSGILFSMLLFVVAVLFMGMPNIMGSAFLGN